MLELSPGITTIEDDVRKYGHFLIKYFTSLHKNKDVAVCVISLEKHTRKWKVLLGEHETIVSCTSPHDWSTTLLSTLDITKNKTIIVIDSINQLSAMVSWDYCLQILKIIKHHVNVTSAIVLFHKDCALGGNLMMKHLQYISQTYIKLLPHVNDKYHVNITSNATGKVKTTNQQITYNTMTSVWTTSHIKNLLNSNKEKESLPSDFASFKISVDKKAKAVKDKMVLPYTEAGQTEGKVLYYHDAGDDWDDDDPDDDLSI